MNAKKNIDTGTALLLPHPLFPTRERLANIPPCVIHYLGYLQTKVALPEIQKEFELTLHFLKAYAGSADTFNAYRRDIERFLQWAWLIARKPVIKITRHDVIDYIEFIKRPPPDWIMTTQKRRFIEEKDGGITPNPDWRPFRLSLSKVAHKQGLRLDKKAFQLSPASKQVILACLSTYCMFLMQEDYLPNNPVQLIRQKSRLIQTQQSVHVIRRFTETQWNALITTAEIMANSDQKDERLLFVMSVFYLLGLRISEMAETPERIPCMGHFAMDKQGLWWFTTIGKGNKRRDVAVPDSLLDGLKRYRISRGLPPLPTRAEKTPLVHKLKGQGGLGTRHVRYLVQRCFDQAVLRLRQSNQMAEADDLETATVHWLRHTAISVDIEARPREHIQDDVGHSHSDTLNKYIDIDRQARHASAKGKKLKPFRT